MRRPIANEPHSLPNPEVLAWGFAQPDAWAELLGIPDITLHGPKLAEYRSDWSKWLALRDRLDRQWSEQ